MKLTVAGFLGANKALHAKLLPTGGVGADSQNQKPGRGDLRPWKSPSNVAAVPSSRLSIYRFGRAVASDANYWFSWTTVVHAVRGYNSEDATERTYYTGSGAPKWTDNTIALASTPYPTAYRQLGVPAPASALVATGNADGASVTMETRFFVYTYVTNIGEESAPSPVSAGINVKIDDTAALASIASPPGGSYTIDRVRIYKTQSGQSATDFYFEREIASAVATSSDDLRTLGEPLQTTTWEMPPSDLSFLTAMWNGMLAGISGTGVRFCEPYAPYAWPPEFEILPPDAIPQALGRWQQNLLVLTTARPLLIVGSSPDSLDEQPLDFAEPCVGPRGVVSFGHGVAWPCPDGLAYYGNGGGRIITDGLFTRDDWQAMNPSGMVAGIYEGAYLCFYTDAGAVRRGFLIDPLNPTGVYFLTTGYDALFFDELQDALYVLSGTNVQKWDAGSLMTATFQSKVFTTPDTNFCAGCVVADSYPVTLKVDAGPFSSAEQTALLAARPALTAVGTTHVRFTKSVADSKPFRLPDGFVASEWQLQVDTTGAPVQSATISTDFEDAT